MRNPIFLFNGHSYQTIGDVHLGRKYVNGVPIHMRGEMEKLQREKFTNLLSSRTDGTIVLVGDLLDSFIVDPADVDFASAALLGAARRSPLVLFVVLGGNHDESKDLTRVSSFDNFKAIIREAGLKNVVVVEKPTILNDVGYISWSARYSAKELAEQLIKEANGKQLHAVFGHWDINLPSHANHYNMVPTEQLKAITKIVVTGHDHKPKEVLRDGVTITATGSIMPLAHGEELEDDEMFFTISRKEYDENPKKYDRKFVRFVLNEDEDLPDGDFLQIKAYVKPTKTTVDTNDPDEQVSFDVPKLLAAYLKKEGIDDKKVVEVVERFNAKQDRD